MKLDYNKTQAFLSDKYAGAQAFLDTILTPIFSRYEWVSSENRSELDEEEKLRPLAEQVGIEEVLQVGYFEHDENIEPYYLFDITVRDSVQMARNRVGVQRIIRRILDDFSHAFMLFHYEDTDRWDWRFSYCHKGGANEADSDAKRYTYLLGKGQSCRTAAERFVELSKNENLSVDAIKEAFNVESLSDEFFEKYRNHYADLVEYITGKRYVKVSGKWVERQTQEPCEIIYSQFQANFSDPDKTVRDYIKKLMGRLVFLQFLQKKGWLGVPADHTDWVGGDPAFLQNCWKDFADKENFVDNFLEPLFDDLNTRRENDLASPKVGQGIKIPYLNGGLFELDQEDILDLPLPEQYIGGILQFFSEYNFTIDENDPNDAQVGVDPEMLGRIFENLLEDNKDKGAYYTPKPIVKYMCAESLIAYLKAGLEENEQDIRDFVKSYDAEKLPTELRDTISKKLRDVKICDPAIGSGAFPVGLLNELFLCLGALEMFDNPAEIKKHIIQHSIYGVDIEKGAVDIARLRFWLSIVVDEATPETLPNLDYKIMQGNSLLEQYEGIDLSKLLPETIVDTKTKIKASFFEDEFCNEKKYLQDKLIEYYNSNEQTKKDTLREEISQTIRKQIRSRGVSVDLSNINLSANNHFFLWHTWFHDVFSQGGFDIVIGNPPYIDSETMMKSMPELRELYKNLFFTAKGNWDIYVVFFEVGMSMLNDQGVLSYITPNKWISIAYGKALRERYYENLHSLCDCQRIKVFEAGNEPVISLFINRCLKHINVSRFEANYNCHQIQSIPKERIGKDNLGMCISENFSILANITKQEKIIGDYIDVENPFSTSEAYDLIELLRDGDFPQSYKLINTGTIDPYISLWGVKVTSYLKGKYVYPTIRLNDFQSKFPKRVRQASSPKIVITGMRYFECYLDMEGCYVAGKSTIILLNPKEQRYLKIILGILNSKLITFYIRGSYSTLGIGGGINFSRDMVENLPLPVLSTESHKIITYVDNIIYAKNKNISADTSALESEIDSLVYQLYGLTEEEIKIIEES